MLINAKDPYQDLLEEFEKIKPWKRGGKKRKKKKKNLILFYFGGGGRVFPLPFVFTCQSFGKHVGVQ
jgi:hypothetical protein